MAIPTPGFTSEDMKVLAIVMWAAEDARRAVRTDPDNPLNKAYEKINAMGEELGRALGLDPTRGTEQLDQ